MNTSNNEVIGLTSNPGRPTKNMTAWRMRQNAARAVTSRLTRIIAERMTDEQVLYVDAALGKVRQAQQELNDVMGATISAVMRPTY